MKDNKYLQQLIVDLKRQSKKENVKLWQRVASDLEAPNRNKRVVNVYKLALHSKENEVVIVPGKLLGSGELAHKITVAAYQVSAQARDKILKANGKVLDLYGLMKTNPKANNV